MTLRNVVHAISCGVAMCALAATGPDMVVQVLPNGSLEAQSLASRIESVPRGTPARFSFATRAGVCGDGYKIISRRGSGTDDYSIMQMESNGNTISYNTTSKERRDELLRNCQDGPAYVQVTRGTDGLSAIHVAVGTTTRNDGQDLGTVPAADAVGYLLDAAAVSREKVGSKALFAASLAGAPEELAAGLNALTRRKTMPQETRINAIYWLGQTHDPRTMTRLREILDDDSEATKVRESAIFGIAQQKTPESTQILLAIARSDSPSGLRKTAVFWLGQNASDKATAGLTSIAGDDSEELDVRESAIYAISQQKSSESVDMLIKVATTSKEPRLRRTAMYWLGQRADDPRVLKLFQDILTKN